MLAEQGLREHAMLCSAAMSTLPRPCPTVSCTLCARVKELDARGFSRDAGSIVQARCGHHFCTECLLERLSRAAPDEYECEHPGCCQSVAPFTIYRNIGDGTEPFTTECAWSRKIVGSKAALLEPVMTRASGRNLRPRTTAYDAVAAQMAVQECRLLSLPPALMGLVWPAERGVLGMRVCKQLRRDLVVYCRSIVLTHKTGTLLSEDCISEDLRRLPKCALVTLRLKKGNWINSLLGVLSECKALSRLDLSGATIGGEGAGVLVGVLGVCKALTHLDLSHNKIRGEGAGALSGVLGECKTLAHLNLSRNDIGAEGARRLAGVLVKCKALAHLSLQSNMFGAAGAGVLADFLGKCKALGHLDLSFNMIGADGAQRLAGALEESKTLSHLYLNGNGFGAEGAGALVGMLRECKTLSHLGLSNNEIGFEGVESLGGALSQCNALASLDLRSNKIGAAGAGALAGVLGECKALTHLLLSDNSIGDEGAERLAGVLGQCTALTWLCLVMNGMSAAGTRRLRAGAREQCEVIAEHV